MKFQYLQPSERQRRGLGQVEVVVSSIIVGVVLIGALKVLGAAKRTDTVAANYLDAPGLAHQLMGEILALPYEDPEDPNAGIGLEGTETNTTRADFDDIDDYEGWNQDPPENKDGTLMPGYTDWRRQVWVTYIDPVTGTAGGSTDHGVKMVHVKISPPSGLELDLQVLRCRWGSLEQTPGVDTTVVTNLDAQLQIGSNSEPAIANIHIKNHASD